MKTRQARSGTLGALLVPCLLVLAVVDCGGCEQPVAHPGPAQGAGSGASATEPAGAGNLDFSQIMEEPFPRAQIEPEMGWLRQYAGEMDVKNLYRSTIMLALENPLAHSDCSGVLLGARLALTAASCVCALGDWAPVGGGGGFGADASSCVKRVFVTTVVYGPAGHPQYQEVTAQTRLHATQGTVRPHPGLELILNEKGHVVGGRADLAVILLDDALEVTEPGFLLSRDEVRAGELLKMVGYGHDKAVGGFHGARYLQRGRAVGGPASGSDRFFYEQQGVSAYHGFNGGPCFREEDGRRWLVGVASVSPGQDLECTSTTFYRKWLLEEMKHAEALPPKRWCCSPVRGEPAAARWQRQP